MPVGHNRLKLTLSVALYGKPYITAAKDTWRLFKDRGWPLDYVHLFLNV